MTRSRTPKLPAKAPFEITMKSQEAGTLIWLLPERLSRDLEALPAARQEEFREIVRLRMSHLVGIFVGLLKNPSIEKDFGRELDFALSELVDHLAALIERPKVVH